MGNTKPEINNSRKKRPVDLVVISDVHLGTYGCHATELVRYMKSIKPKKVILNGDIIDIWQFNKKYWPKSHMQVIKEVTSWTSKGIKVYYVTGNHDEMLRRFDGFKVGSLRIVNKLLLEIGNKKVWVFHGDVFDVTMQHARWLTKLGAVGYDMLILLNRICNNILIKLGREKISLSKKIKNSVKSAVKYVNDFEKTCADIAIENQYDYVVCGHIHHPEIKEIKNKNGSVQYMNSGDWVENLTALEYHEGNWRIYHYNDDVMAQAVKATNDEYIYMDNESIFKLMLNDFQYKPLTK